MNAVIDVDVAVRAFPVVVRKERLRRQPGSPSSMVAVVDTETRTDLTQRLLFGSYRVYTSTRLVEEGLIAGGDLSASEQGLLEAYAKAESRCLRLLSRDEFADRILWRVVYRGRATLVGFNLFFDLSRLALGWRPARGPTFGGGVSLRFWPEWVGPDGRRRPHQFRPEIRVKALDSRRTLIQFTTPARAEMVADDGLSFPGHFVDCRTLAYAYSDKGHSLESACLAFGVDRPKRAYSGRHGVLTREYVDYNREDVRATYELFRKLEAEHARHPI